MQRTGSVAFRSVRLRKSGKMEHILSFAGNFFQEEIKLISVPIVQRDAGCGGKKSEYLPIQA
jgi:hypothetical protein